MMKKNLLFRLLLVMTLFSAVSCSDDDNLTDLPDTNTLNMLNETNGKTKLGSSDVYINKANNFKTSSCVIAELGEGKGIGAVVPPKVGDGLVQETAVLPNCLYQIFDVETIRDFPSGVRAIMVGASYYQVFVESPITAENATIGAVVKFAPIYPDPNELPKYRYEMGEVSYMGQSVQMDFPEDVEFFYYGGIPEVFYISTSDGKLSMSLKETPSEYNGIRGSYEVYVRRGNVFTELVVRVR